MSAFASLVEFFVDTHLASQFLDCDFVAFALRNVDFIGLIAQVVTEFAVGKIVVVSLNWRALSELRVVLRAFLQV